MCTLKLLLKLTSGSEAVPKTEKLVTFQRPMQLFFPVTAYHELRTVVSFNRRLLFFSAYQNYYSTSTQIPPYHSTTVRASKTDQLKNLKCKLKTVKILCWMFNFFKFYKEAFFIRYRKKTWGK